MYSGGSGGDKRKSVVSLPSNPAQVCFFLFLTGDSLMQNTRLALAAIAAVGLLRNAEVGVDGSGEVAQQAVAPAMPAGYTALTQKFNFKTRKITDDSGKEIGRTKKHDSINVTMPVPTADTLIGYLATPDSAVAKLLMDAANGIIVDAVRSQFDELIESFGDDDSKTLSVNDIDFSKLSLDYIASIPPSQRGGVALTEEDFNAFFADYLITMVAATGKEEKRIKNQIELFKRPTKVKSAKDVLAVLVDQLDVYLANSQALEDTGEVATRLRAKFDKWAKEPEKQVNLDLL
jgi:hypothetical protein